MQQGWAPERKGYMVTAELAEDSQTVVSVSPLAVNEKTAKRCRKAEVFHFTFMFHIPGEIQFAL